MCPVALGITVTTAYVMAATAAIAAAYAVTKSVAANKQADRQSKLLTQQAIQRDGEINQAAGQQLNERAKAARQERASARSAAAESGVNLGSGSFLAQLTTSQINESNDNGLITKNAENQKKSAGIQYQSGLAKLQKTSGLGIAFGAIAAGSSAAYGSFTAGGGSLSNVDFSR